MNVLFRLIVGSFCFYGFLWLIPGYAPVKDIPYYDNVGFSVIAHRGCRGLLPGNTLEAAVNAIEIGSNVIEIDVHLTADKVLVVRHDAEIDTTSNGKGSIVDMTLESIQSYQAGFHEIDYPNAISPAGMRIPTLNTMFQRLPNQRYLIELKPTHFDAADALCDQILAHHLQNQVMVGSFHSSVLTYFRKTCPVVPTSLGKTELLWFSLLERLGLGHLYDSPGFAMQIPPSFGGLQVVTPELIRLAHRLNLRVDVWTINDTEKMQHLRNLGVDGIITDRPDRLLSTF
jgi:glycerophosphoryl diester phosphodiesterase